MRTVVLGPPPAELEAFLARRHELGHDAYDEVWDGEVHVAPMAHAWHGRVQASLSGELGRLALPHGLELCGPFNLGVPDDFRIPDAGLFETGPDTSFVATAVLVVEVVSPDDETFEKFDFYAAAGVREILTADPQERRVRVWRRQDAAYLDVERSDVLQTSADALTAAVRWPT